MVLQPVRYEVFHMGLIPPLTHRTAVLKVMSS